MSHRDRDLSTGVDLGWLPEGAEGLPRTYDTRPWIAWNRFDWSEALLAHYFRRGPDRDGPVRVVVATADELAEATGDLDADPGAVADSLRRSVLNAVGEKNYWRHAEEGIGGERPTFLAHLILACTAAVDLTDIDERSYIERLCGLV